MRDRTVLPWFAILALLSPLAVQAHPGHAAGEPLWTALLHPFHGWDHLVIALGIGLWSTATRRPILQDTAWATGAIFVGICFSGVLPGAAGWAVPFSLVGMALFLLVNARKGQRGVRWMLCAIAWLHGLSHSSPGTMPLSLGVTLLFPALSILAFRTLVSGQQPAPRWIAALLLLAGLTLFSI